MAKLVKRLCVFLSFSQNDRLTESVNHSGSYQNANLTLKMVCFVSSIRNDWLNNLASLSANQKKSSTFPRFVTDARACFPWWQASSACAVIGQSVVWFYFTDRFRQLSVVRNSNLSVLRFFVCCICIIMKHSHLNHMEILGTKRFIPKDLNWIQHWVSRIDLLPSKQNWTTTKNKTKEIQYKTFAKYREGLHWHLKFPRPAPVWPCSRVGRAAVI